MPYAALATSPQDAAVEIPEDDIRDVTVIGAGPAGLFTVFSAGIQEMQCHIIDSMPQVGGQLTALYPEKMIYDVPGFPAVTAKELVERLEEQALQFKPSIHLNETVIGVERLRHRVLQVTTDRGNVFYSRAVVIACGIGAFSPRVPDDEMFAAVGEENGVFTCVTDKSRFAGEDVVILGGGDSALDWVLGLAENARSMTLVHRRNNFRAMRHSQTQMAELVEAGTVQVYKPHSFHTMALDDNKQIAKVVIEEKSGDKVDLPCTRLLCLIGFKNDLGPIVDWDLRFEENSIKVDADMQTNIPGVFAVGDIATYPQKINLILTGFADASIAIQNSVPYVRPGKKASHVFSSVRGLPGAKG